MADVKENALTTKSPVAAGDKLRGIGVSDSESYNMLVQDVAKYIIENYTGSSVAGSAQSVKAALDALNSKITSTALPSTITDLNSISETSAYFIMGVVPTNAPSGAGIYSGLILTYRQSSTYLIQIYIQAAGSAGALHVRRHLNGNWTSWYSITA